MKINASGYSTPPLRPNAAPQKPASQTSVSPHSIRHGRALDLPAEEQQGPAQPLLANRAGIPNQQKLEIAT